MKNSLIKSLPILSVALICLSIIMAFSIKQAKPWPVPDNYKSMKNPLAGDAASVNDGKALYSTHCKSCHGNKGLGDGNKAAQLKTEPGDFSNAAFQGQSDGALFYKTSEGRDDMPSFKKKIPEADERWSIINYLRTFKK
jgi:mono/diheme cytochrome c family protein